MFPIRILIADGHVMLADALKLLFDVHVDIQCVGTATDGVSALKAALQQRPDVLLLDLGLSQLDGLGVMKGLQSLDAPPRVLVVTARMDAGSVRAAFALGATGYFSKSENFSDLLLAIRRVAEGRRYISNEMVTLLMEDTRELETKTSSSHIKLTGSEVTILQFVGNGFTSKEIGRRLGISDGTVRKHRENLRKKIGTRTSSEMAAYAIRTLEETRYQNGVEIGVSTKFKSARLDYPLCASHTQ